MMCQKCILLIKSFKYIWEYSPLWNFNPQIFKIKLGRIGSVLIKMIYVIPEWTFTVIQIHYQHHDMYGQQRCVIGLVYHFTVSHESLRTNTLSSSRLLCKECSSVKFVNYKSQTQLRYTCVRVWVCIITCSSRLTCWFSLVCKGTCWR